MIIEMRRKYLVDKDLFSYTFYVNEQSGHSANS